MARPSVKAERTEEILIAFEQCVAQYGIEGATLERLATQSGLQRSLVRHYVGNREELITALIDRFLSQTRISFGELFSHLTSLEDNQELMMINMLFDPDYLDSTQTAVASALITYSGGHPDIANLLRIWIEDIESGITDVLKKSHENEEKTILQEIAAGVLGIYFNVDSLEILGNMAEFRNRSRRSALRLISTLT
ncbi:MAG: hypothetical protein KUG73_11875 [Pseudomonadales bacterium]|nr:hypothetical protein [Pseudomonadales bacterium]